MAAIHAFTGGTSYSANLVTSDVGSFVLGTGWSDDNANNEYDYTSGGGSLTFPAIDAQPSGTFLIEYQITSGGGNTYFALDNGANTAIMGPHGAPGTYQLEVTAPNQLTQVRIFSSSGVSIRRDSISVQRKY